MLRTRPSPAQAMPVMPAISTVQVQASSFLAKCSRALPLFRTRRTRTPFGCSGGGLDAEVVDLVQETVEHDGDHALYGVLSKLFGVYRLHHRPLASQLDLDSFRIVDGPKVALGCPPLRSRHHFDALHHEPDDSPAPL
jgi:hypothetical protein